VVFTDGYFDKVLYYELVQTKSNDRSYFHGASSEAMIFFLAILIWSNRKTGTIVAAADFNWTGHSDVDLSLASPLAREEGFEPPI
jgi:hypothetical protein